MPRRTSFAEVSRSVTKKTSVRSELKRRVTGLPDKLKRKDSSKLSNTPRQALEEVKETESEEKPTQPEQAQTETTAPEKPADTEAAEKVDDDVNKDLEQTSETVTLGGGEENTEIVVLGEDHAAEGEDDAEKEEEEEEEKKAETEGNRKLGRPKRLTKKQLRLQQERLEEEQERAARRARREERRRKKELKAELAEQEAPQTVDEAAFKQSIYQLVQTSLNLVMPQGEINITVDNLTPLMKGLELDTGDEDVKDVILEALLDSYGIIPPATIDGLILKKQMENNLDELEECVDTAFAIIDQDRDGLITTNDIYRLMIHLGEVLWDEQVNAILQAADVDGDGRISKKDLFLFLLGQEKTVKLEDQILNRYGSKEDAEDDKAAAPADPSPPPGHASRAKQGDAKAVEVKTPAAASSGTSTAADPGTATATGSGTSTASGSGSSTAAGSGTSAAAGSGPATLKAKEPTEDSQAFERRKRMFSGYSSQAVTSNSISDSTPSSAQQEEDEVDGKVVTPDRSEPDGQSDDNTGLKEREGDETMTEKNTAHDPELGKEDEDEVDNENQIENEGDGDHEDVFDQPHVNSSREPTPAPHVHVGSSDWSDSGLVGSDQDADSYADESEEELQSMGVPLALEAGLCYLPAPKFDSVASPVSPRSPRSRRSSMSQTTTPRLNHAESRMDTPAGSEFNTSRQEALRGFNEDMDRPVHPDSAHDAGDAAGRGRTSEYDSEREGDEDSLPETSQQNLILKEIEKQVLHTKEALAAKSPCSLAGVKLKERFAAMVNHDVGDGCESVVESEIHPVYVPPCARDPRRGSLKLPVIQTAEDRAKFPGEGEDGDDVDHASPGGAWRKRELDKKHSLGVDLLKVDEYATSTAEIISRGFASLSSPRSASSVATKLLSNDLTDDVFSPLDEISAREAFPDLLDGIAFSQKHSYLNDYRGFGRTRETMDEVESMANQEEEEEDTFNLQEPVSRANKDVVVNHFQDSTRPTSDRGRKMSARRQPHPPLRRSLTCHLVTVKDLTGSVHSPTRGDTAVLTRRQSSIGPNSFMPIRRESSLSRKESPVSRRESAAVLPDSRASRSRPPFSARRASSMPREDSPSGRRESTVSRVYSPTGRLESFQAFDSSRTSRNCSSRSQKTSSRIWDSSYWDSARSQKDSSRSQRETWRSNRDSHRGRWESAQNRADASAGQSGDRTDRSGPEEDDSVEEEEEFRFYGPNFDVIMSQKGEPEEMLRESLYRDAVARAIARRPADYDMILSARDRDGSPAQGESKREMISQQLERVKEMELLIKQRRQAMGTDENKDNNNSNNNNNNGDATEESSQKPQTTVFNRDARHRLRRARTATHLRSPLSALYDHDHDHDHDQLFILGKEGGDLGNNSNNSMRPKARPRSCLAGSRLPLSSPKVVTIADALDVRHSVKDSHDWSRHSSPGREVKAQTQAVHEPKVHVVDLSSLLSDVNEPEPLGDQNSAGDGERKRGRCFKPLARVLVAYETARRRQAATAASREKSADGSARLTATSISRQLEQGIPYRPPTPPQDSGHGDSWMGGYSPRRTNVWHRDNHAARPESAMVHGEIDAVNSAQMRHLPPNHSFMLSSEQTAHCCEEPAPLVQAYLAQNSSEFAATRQKENLQGARGAKSSVPHVSTSREAAASSAMTFEFPERSVCVLKARPAAAVPAGNS